MRFIFWFLAILGVIVIIFYFLMESSSQPPTSFSIWTPEGYDQMSKVDQDALEKRWRSGDVVKKVPFESFKLSDFQQVVIIPFTDSGKLFLTYLGANVENGLIIESEFVVPAHYGFNFPKQPYLLGSTLVVSYIKNWGAIIILLPLSIMAYLVLLSWVFSCIDSFFGGQTREIRVSA